MKKIIPFLALTLSILSCGEDKSDDNLLKKDKKELASNIISDKVTLYKLAKIGIRSLYSEIEEPEEFKTTSKAINSLLATIDEKKSASDISVYQWIQVYRGYKKIKKFAFETDEDIYPTALETLNSFYSADSISKDNTQIKKINGWDSNLEHAVLSIIVMLSKDLGKDIALYECSKTNPEDLPDGEQKILLQYYRGFLFMQEGLYYLSENELSKNIEWLNNNSNISLPHTRSFFGWSNLNDNQTHIGLHAMNHLLRGVDRLMMKRDIDEERALDDFEAFVADFEKLGIQNELVWCIDIYLALKRENPEKAIEKLKLLKASDLLSNSDRDTIDQAIEYLNDRDTDKVLNGVYDKVFLSKIVGKYIINVLSKIDWEKVLEENNVENADKIITTVNTVNETINNLESWTDTEKLKKKGNELLKKAKDFF